MNIESQLVKKAINGDFDSFEELVSIYDRKIYNYCFRMTNNYDDAEDLAQEVFIKVFRSLKSFRGNSKFSTWIYRIAHNTCIDDFRKRRLKLVSLNQDEESDKEIDIPSPELTPEERIISSEQYDFIESCIAELRPEYKSVIVLRDIQNHTYKEIADILEIPIGTVKSHISRARMLLRDALEEHIEGHGERRIR